MFILLQFFSLSFTLETIQYIIMTTILILYRRPEIIYVAAVIKSFWWTDHDANIHPSVCPLLSSPPPWSPRSFGFCQETGDGSTFVLLIPFKAHYLGTGTITIWMVVVLLLRL